MANRMCRSLRLGPRRLPRYRDDQLRDLLIANEGADVAVEHADITFAFAFDQINRLGLPKCRCTAVFVDGRGIIHINCTKLCRISSEVAPWRRSHGRSLLRPPG